jgi:chaperonin GroEL
MIKKLAFNKEARKNLFKGVKTLADAVTITLGPKGRNVAIQRPWGGPIVVHDGVTVAREVESPTPLVNTGVDLVKQAAIKTNEEAGDGTTTATLLAYELVKRGMDLIEEGVNPMILRNQIYDVLPKVLEELKRLSRPVKSNEDIAKVATISAVDPEIGKLVAGAVKRVGEDGLVTVDEGGDETEVEFTEGMEFEKGYCSPYFITNPDRMEAVIHEPRIIIVNKTLTLIPEIMPLLQNAVKVSKDIVLIALSVGGEALVTMVANKKRGNFNAVAVKAPGISDDKQNYLDDIAILTGGKVISGDTGESVTKDDGWLGRAKKVISGRETTVIVGGKGNKKEIESRILGLKNQIKEEKSQFEKEKLEERLARLSTGVGVIKVGAKTEIDMRERVERVKDAVGAATAAREEGIVVGGGSIFLQASKVLKGDTEGSKLLKEILQSPARKLMENCGETNDSINSHIKKILKSEDANCGYNVDKGELADLVKEGIIDPAKVCRLALENAIAVSTSILTTEAIIANEEEESDKKGRG